jgi:hypothetical protein
MEGIFCNNFKKWDKTVVIIGACHNDLHTKLYPIFSLKVKPIRR